MIIKYKLFENTIQDKDYMNELLKLPLEARKEIKRYLIELKNEKANESSFLSDIRFKIKNYIHDKLLLWLLNQSESRLKKQIDLLNLFDPTDFSKVRKCEVIYLGGGIDKTPDEYTIKTPKSGLGASLGAKSGLFQTITNKLKKVIPDNIRNINDTRFTFNIDRGIKLGEFLSEIEMNVLELLSSGGAGWRFEIEKLMGDEHTVSNEDLMKAERTGTMDMSKYPKPLIINPLRKEQSVRDDEQFRRVYAAWKKGEMNQEKDDALFKYMAKVINKDIKTPDLRLLNICDSNIVKYDAVAGDGTKGELQFGALKHYMNVFIWLDGGYEIADISPWTFPEATKIVRNYEELLHLVDSIKKINGI